MQIWLIRHGSTAAGEAGRFQGRLDYPLSARGREEAELLAGRTAALGLDLVLCSNLRRARETALAIARRAGLEPLTLALLNECSWGVLEGMTAEEIARACPPAGALLYSRRAAFLFGGESERRLLARSRLLLKTLHRRFGNCRRVALVSHARLLNALLVSTLGFSTRRRWPCAPSPASLSLLSCDSARAGYRLEVFNDCSHLA